MNRYLQYYQAYSSAFIIVFAVVILLIAAMWRIFSKAGRKGWHCLIPIYNTYVLWEIAWEGKIFLDRMGNRIDLQCAHKHRRQEHFYNDNQRGLVGFRAGYVS